MKHSITVRFLSSRRRIARLSAAAALAVTMVIAVPTMAQVLPEISLRITPQFNPSNESLVSNNGLQVQIRASRGAQGVSVNVFAHTVSGHDRFRNHGVPAYIEQGSRTVYRQRSRATYTSNSTDWMSLGDFNGGRGAGSPLFPDDLLVTGDSVVRVILMPGTGYTINPNMRSVDITVRDTPGESCDAASSGVKYYMPHPQGGLAWGVCTCSDEGPWHPQQRLVNGNRVWVNKGDDGYDEAYGAEQRKWRSDTTNYCPDSPYQRPS